MNKLHTFEDFKRVISKLTLVDTFHKGIQFKDGFTLTLETRINHSGHEMPIQPYLEVCKDGERAFTWHAEDDANGKELAVWLLGWKERVEEGRRKIKDLKRDEAETAWKALID